MTLSQTLSGGGKDTEKAEPERPIQRWGRKRERQEAGGPGCRRAESARGDERRASRGWDWLGISTLLRRTLQRGKQEPLTEEAHELVPGGSSVSVCLSRDVFSDPFLWQQAEAFRSSTCPQVQGP